jgi:CheY-like chemotaxis protein
MRKKRILIAEDEANIQEMYRIAFEQAGFQTMLAGNGQELIDRAREIKPDLVLLDINMPVKDGFEILKEISEDIPLYKLFSHTPIIVLSNYSNPQDIDYCMKRGAQDYLVKSEWTPSAIVKKAKDYLADLESL